ncbi:hypothetical protein ACPCA8_34400 [Streptomyces capoamus]|uniref:hypothetical protein n=1 Tax=Streptomyces capoamus TaxID=68183 RepID=UPI003C2B5F61
MPDLVQAVGRALGIRPGEGKVASLVVPVLLGPGESADNMLTSRAHGGLVQPRDRAFEVLVLRRRTGVEGAPLVPHRALADAVPEKEMGKHAAAATAWRAHMNRRRFVSPSK